MTQPNPPQPDDPAAASFANLVNLSGSRVDPTRLRPNRNRSRQTDQPKNRRRWSGAGPSKRDPQRIDSIFNQLSNQYGWADDVQRGRVLSSWASVVGDQIAGKTQPESLTDGELVIRAESTAWATELRMMDRMLRQRIDRMVGEGVVRKIVVKGPAAPSWKKGPRSVRGRGPRDTYG